MNWGSGITAVLAVLGISLVLIGMMDESSGDRDFPVMALGVAALVAGGSADLVGATNLTP